MTFLRKALQRPSTAAYVAFATLSTPAFAQDALSSLHLPSLPTSLQAMTPRDMLLYGSIALLVVAVALRLARGSARDDLAAPEGPDMRWWKNA
ncbi:MAG: hypothetical protein U1F48_11215 [Burkholderiales bacterium]